MNTTAMDTTHPADHNAISNALTDIINELGAAPHGGSTTVQQRFEVIEANNWVNTNRIGTSQVTYPKLSIAGQLLSTDFATSIKPMVVCTSTTRPASPVSPTLIYETDKDRIRVWDGTSWAYVAGNGPRVTLTRASGTPMTVLSGATTDITWPTEVDLDGLHTAGAAAITVAEAGIYSISWGITTVTTAGNLGLIVTLTAGTKTFVLNQPLSAAATISNSGGVTLPLAASSSVTLSLTNGTGANVTTYGDLYLTLMGR